MTNDKYFENVQSNLTDPIEKYPAPSSHKKPYKGRRVPDQKSNSARSDPIDMLVSKVDDLGDDKYRTPILQETIDDGSDLSQSQSGGFQSDSYYTTDGEGKQARNLTMSTSSCPTPTVSTNVLS